MKKKKKISEVLDIALMKIHVHLYMYMCILAAAKY